MNRRALLSTLAVSIIGTTGCMGESTREVGTLVCNQTQTAQEGTYKITDPENDEPVAYSPFRLPETQTDTNTETTQSSLCREFTSELVLGKHTISPSSCSLVYPEVMSGS